jgi:hypothetical protein
MAGLQQYFTHQRIIVQEANISRSFMSICGLVAESIDHILWSCPSAKDVWAECSPKISKCTSDETDFINIITQLMVQVDEDEMQFIATISRLIWLRRNSVVFGGELMAPATVVNVQKSRWKCGAKQTGGSPNVK